MYVHMYIYPNVIYVFHFWTLIFCNCFKLYSTPNITKGSDEIISIASLIVSIQVIGINDTSIQASNASIEIEFLIKVRTTMYVGIFIEISFYTIFTQNIL